MATSAIIKLSPGTGNRWLTRLKNVFFKQNLKKISAELSKISQAPPFRLTITPQGLQIDSLTTNAPPFLLAESKDLSASMVNTAEIVEIQNPLSSEEARQILQTLRTEYKWSLQVTLARHGIEVKGPDGQSAAFPVSWNDIYQEIVPYKSVKKRDIITYITSTSRFLYRQSRFIGGYRMLKALNLGMGIRETSTRRLRNILARFEDKNLLARLSLNWNLEILGWVMDFGHNFSQVDHFWAIQENPRVKTLLKLAKETSDPKDLAMPAKIPIWHIREAAAKNSHLTDELFETLAQDKDLVVRKAAAQNEKCPEKVIRKLAKDKEIDVKKAVAKNPNTPDDILGKWAKDNEYQNEVKENPKVKNLIDLIKKTSSHEDLRMYAQHPIWFIRKAVAENTNAPKDLLITLAGDKILDVQAAVAGNKNTPQEVIKKLARKKWFKNNIAVRRAAVTNENCPEKVLKKLARDKNWSVREAVAKNQNTPQKLRTKLAKDKDWDVRQAAEKTIRKLQGK